MKDRTVEYQFIESFDAAARNNVIPGILTILFISLIASPTFVA
jgi:hypothetical protein